MKWLITIPILLMLSCATTDSKRISSAGKVQEMDEKTVRAAALNVAATGMALKTAPNTNLSVRVATQFNEKAALLLPTPEYQEVRDYSKIVAGLTSEIQSEREKAQVALDGKDDQIALLQSQRAEEAAKLSALEKKLVDLGNEYEKERNKSWWTRIYSTLGIGGLIALCVCFPVAIPIIGNLLGSLVNAVPSLASAVGLVSRKAFDSVVTAVQKTKEKLKADDKSDSLMILKDELEKATDSSHRNLIASRKESLNI